MSVIYNKEKIEKQDNVSYIKDYIHTYETNFNEKVVGLEESEEEVKKPVKEPVKEPKEKKSNYHVLLSSGIDTIIERRTRKSIIQLIMIATQDKYLLKTKDTIQNISDMDEKDFKEFFRFLVKDEKIEVNNIIFHSIGKEDIIPIYNMIRDYRSYLSKGLMSYPLYKRINGIHRYIPHYYSRRITPAYAELLKNEKVLKCLTVKTPIREGTDKYGEEFIQIALSIEKNAGYDAMLYFAESYTKSSMKDISLYDFSYGFKTIDTLFTKKYNLNIKRLIEYLCFDLYGQGFSTIPLNTYRDYIQMSYAFYDGRIKDKYPKALMTQHDIMAQNVAQSNEIKEFLEAMIKTERKESEMKEKEAEAARQAEEFKKVYSTFKENLGITDNTVFSYKDIFLKIPDGPKEFISEGSNLGHCVATYISRVARNECLILFARKKEEPDTSYLTVEIRPSHISSYKGAFYSIAQVQGDMKRTKLTKSEIEFFKKFMEKYEILSTNQNFR